MHSVRAYKMIFFAVFRLSAHTTLNRRDDRAIPC